MSANEELTDRQKMILQAVVDLHISEGEPIGSKFLIEKKQIPYSSATVRNEMATLEELGYLTHPHTSAGRIPSPKGYRYYVDSLADDYDMAQNEVEELSELLKNKTAKMDEIIGKAAKIAGAVTNYSSMSLMENEKEDTVIKFSVVLTDSYNILLVMVFAGGDAKTKKITLPYAIDEESAAKIERVLNSNLTGIIPEQINLPLLEKMETEMGSDSALISPLSKAIYKAMVGNAEQSVNFEGISRLLQYPEFSDIDRFGSLLSLIENKNEIINMVSGAEEDDVNIYIGSETGSTVLRTSTLIYKPIRQGGKMVGAIGVLGPRRMDYSKVIGTIKRLSKEIENMQNNNMLTDGGNKDD